MLKPLVPLVLTASAASSQVTLINVFDVPDGQRDAAVAAWEISRDFLSQQPGYVKTTLYGAVSEDARFQLVNVATWHSVDEFTAAIAAMREGGKTATFQELGVRFHPGLYMPLFADELIDQ